MRSLLVFLLPLALIASPQRSDAATGNLPAPRLGDILAAGGFTLPHAWAGIWQSTTIDSNCVTHTFVSSTTQADTLCTGQSLGGVGPFSLTCSGTTSDTAIDVTCSGTMEVDSTCTWDYTVHLVATRNGESLQATTVSTSTFTPTLCAFIQDSCTMTVTTATRLTPVEPASCSSPVEPATWGRMKSRYR